MNSIGKKITQLRTEMGYTQKQLAKLANITEASLSRYENGLREPKINTLVKLAKVLGCTVDYMVGNTDVVDGVIVDRQKLPELLKTVDLKYLSIAKDLEHSEIPAEDLRAIVEIIAKIAQFNTLRYIRTNKEEVTNCIGNLFSYFLLLGAN